MNNLKSVYKTADDILGLLDREERAAAPSGNAAQSAALAISRARNVGGGALRQAHLAEAQRHIARMNPARERAAVQNLQGHVLALQGRGRDTRMAHVTPRELVIPQRLQTPEFVAMIARMARAAGIEPRSLRVGDHRGKFNPRTGHQEFDDDGILDLGGVYALPEGDFNQYSGGDSSSDAGDAGDGGNGAIVDDDGNPIEGITVTASPDAGSHWWDDMNPIGTAMAGGGTGNSGANSVPTDSNGNPVDGITVTGHRPSQADLQNAKSQIENVRGSIEPAAGALGVAAALGMALVPGIWPAAAMLAPVAGLTGADLYLWRKEHGINQQLQNNSPSTPKTAPPPK